MFGREAAGVRVRVDFSRWQLENGDNFTFSAGEECVVDRYKNTLGLTRRSSKMHHTSCIRSTKKKS